MDTRRLYPDQFRQIAITERVVAACHQKGAGVVEHLVAYGIFVHSAMIIYY